MNWSEFKQQVERWLYNFSTLFSFFTQFISSTAGDATWSYRKEDGTIEDKIVPNIAKIRLGDPTKRLKVADAINNDEAVNLNKLHNTSLNELKTDFTIQKTLNFSDGNFTEILEFVTDMPFGAYLFDIQLQTAGHGGAIWGLHLNGILASFFCSNNAGKTYSIPFTESALATNGRTFEVDLMLKGNHDNCDQGSRNVVRVKINGESSTNVPVTIRLKRIF